MTTDPKLRPGTTMYRTAELESITRELRGDVRELRGRLGTAERRIRELEGQTPHARQLQDEADLAMADAAAAGCGPDDPVLSIECQARWHVSCRSGVHPGMRCDRYCHADEDQAGEPEPGDYGPGSEVGDEGGTSEYRSYATIQDTWGER
jgi:hypothetical protein